VHALPVLQARFFKRRSRPSARSTRLAQTPDSAICFRRSKIGGALGTAAVELDSIADRAGIRRGDIILSFGGLPLRRHDVIQEMPKRAYPLKQPGHVARSIDIRREGKTVQLTLRW
jgi:hypothetical protein